MSTLQIGFKDIFYTLWSVSEPYKVYTGKYSYYYQVDKNYIRNLAIDEVIAKAKAEKFGVKNLEVNPELRGTSNSFSTRGEEIDETPFFMYPSRIHRYGCGDIREMGSNRATKYDNEQEIKALWVLYLKKDIVFCGENPCKPEWRKPIVLARRRLLELGVLVRYDRKVLAASYLDTYKKNQALKQLKSTMIKGWHFEDNTRVGLQLKQIDFKSFNSEWGVFNVITYMDINGFEFSYSGGSNPQISEDEFTNVKGTISHSTYKDEQITKLKRISIVKQKAMIK